MVSCKTNTIIIERQLDIVVNSSVVVKHNHSIYNVHITIEPVVTCFLIRVFLVSMVTYGWWRSTKEYYCSCCMTLMQVYLRLLLFVLYDTNAGLLKSITVRVVCHRWNSTYDYYWSCCMTLMKVYLRLLLFVLYVTDDVFLKIITVRGVWY